MKNATDAILKDIPELFHQCRKCLLQIRHLFFHVRLDALAFGSGRLWRARRDCFSSGGRLESFRCRRDSRLRMRRRRGGRAEEPGGKTCRCRFRTASTEGTECVNEWIESSPDVVPG